MTDRVRVDRRAGIADVFLARPEKLNALDEAMFDALIETGKALADDRTLRAVVLSGEGRSFCAGLDFASFMSKPQVLPQMLSRTPESIANRAQRAAWVWVELPVPVIAAIHGHALGGGLQLAAAADIRFVAPDAKLSIREVEMGLIPDMSGTQTLRHLLRHDVLAELTYTGRTVSGSEAVALGLATHVADDPHAAALALAEEIAGKSPHAVRAGKRLLRATIVGSTEAGLQVEEDVQRTLLGSRNQLEAAMASMQKRKPSFEDP